MPVVDAYRRAPLANAAFVPFSDGAVQVGGAHKEMTSLVLALADIASMTPLDAVMASKLEGYTDLPPMPNVLAAAGDLRENPHGFIMLARAAFMCATANRDKDGLLRVLESMRVFLETLGELSEEQVFALGADALRVVSELYRRTGMPFLLEILEKLRAQLPDVSGLMHSFPFTGPYEVHSAQGMDEAEVRFHKRMEQFATGSLMADALAMTGYLALFSGSSRDGSAGKAGISALMRYHGAPNGGFTADPYLAGRDPARAVDLRALCAQVEAYCDLLWASGDLTLADRLELLSHSALPDLLDEKGARTLQPINRLFADDSCIPEQITPQDSSALLRALYALRRTVWMAKGNDEIALLLPMDGGCLTRIGGVPVRLTSTMAGTFEKTVSISVEARQSVPFTLFLRVPGYATEAGVSINGGKEQLAEAGTLFGLRRTFNSGDVIKLRIRSLPRLETGFRGGLSVLCGPELMALPIPQEDVGWQFALVQGGALTPVEENGNLQVLATATDVPGWAAKNGFITPPPQGVSVGGKYELILLPFAKTRGRIAVFPQATARE